MNKNTIIILIGLVLIVVIVGVYMFQGNGVPKQNNGQNQQNQQTMENLQIIDEVMGTGIEAKAGNLVTVNYTGTLTSGAKFDSSYDRNEPFTFQLGAGQVIPGWDQGVAGMKVGGKRKLVIPPILAYGDQAVGNGLIPANSTLIFEIELLNVQPAQ